MSTRTPFSSVFGAAQIPLNFCELNELTMQLHCYQESEGGSELSYITQEVTDIEPEGNILTEDP